MTRARDVADLRRNTVIWLVAEAWILAGYALQDPARDPVDAAERGIFTLVMGLLLPLVSAGILVAWWGLLRTRSGAGEDPGTAAL